MDSLSINQLVEISVDEINFEYKGLSSRVEEINNEHILLSAPTYRGEILPLRTGMRIKVSYVLNDCAYSFNTSIVARKKGPLPIIIINKPHKIIRVQRRHWVRVASTLDIEYSSISATPESNLTYTGKTIDISGGGVRFITKGALEPGEIINLKIYLPSRSPVITKARIIRILEKAKSEGESNKAVLEYSDINENDRERIIKYVFEKQRELIKKGLV